MPASNAAARPMLGESGAMVTSKSNVEALCREVESAVGVLDELLKELVRASHDGSAERPSASSVGWLRPLAVMIVELEFTVRHRARVDEEAISEAANALLFLLEPGALGAGEFAERYARERTASVEAARLHARACEACRTLSLASARGGEDIGSGRHHGRQPTPIVNR
jgi:hypothetical protein